MLRFAICPHIECHRYHFCFAKRPRWLNEVSWNSKSGTTFQNTVCYKKKRKDFMFLLEKLE